MTKEYIYNILKIVWVILLLFTLASNFLFTRGGFVTRKTLKVTYIGYLFLLISGLLFYWFAFEAPPNNKILNIICIGGTFIIFSAYSAFKYYFVGQNIDEIAEQKANNKH